MTGLFTFYHAHMVQLCTFNVKYLNFNMVDVVQMYCGLFLLLILPFYIFLIFLYFSFILTSSVQDQGYLCTYICHEFQSLEWYYSIYIINYLNFVFIYIWLKRKRVSNLIILLFYIHRNLFHLIVHFKTCCTFPIKKLTSKL